MKTLLTNLLASMAFFTATAGAAATDPALASIAAQWRALTAAIGTRDAAAIGNLFTADARLSVSMSRGVVKGRADITGFWQAALDAGLQGLELEPADWLGEGKLRVGTGSFKAFGPGHGDLGHGQYLMVWMKEQGEWRIARDFVRADSAPMASSAPDRVGLPADYATRLHRLGGTLNDEQQGLTTVYANDLVASLARTEQAHYPDGSVILMEFAEPQRDGEQQLIRDAQGQPLKGAIAHIDVMRRGSGFGAMYGDSRAGDWEFASYRPDGSVLIAPANAAHCAACHVRAGESKDFVFRKRSWE